jgi:hypothetical protein
MTHFLVIFDRAEGRVLREEPFSDRSAALKARFEAERLHRESSDIEVVVLSANSADDLRRTHARYFQSAGELARGGLKYAEALEAQRRRVKSNC